MPSVQSDSLSSLQSQLGRGLRTKEISQHSSKVHTVAWNSDGRRLASGSADRSVCVLQLASGLSKECVLRGHSDAVDQLCWHPSHPDLLATASADKSVRLWDVRQKSATKTVNTKGENINIAWAPDGEHVAAGNKDELVTFVNVHSGKVVREEQFKFEVNEIKWGPDSNHFFVTSGLGSVHILSFPDLKLEHVLKAHPGNCICIEFTPSGDKFAVGSADALVSIWDTQNLYCLRTIARLDWPIRTLSFSHDGMLLASASEDTVIDVAHVESGERVAKVAVSAPTFTAAFHPRRHLLAFACDDKKDRDKDAGTLKVWGFTDDET